MITRYEVNVLTSGRLLRNRNDVIDKAFSAVGNKYPDTPRVIELRDYLSIDNPCIRAEGATDSPVYIAIEEKKYEADKRTNNPVVIDGYLLSSKVLYKQMVHDSHYRKDSTPKNYLLTLQEKDFVPEMYFDLIMYGNITSALCAAYIIADRIRRKIVEPHINTLTNKTEARAQLKRLNSFICDKILNRQQIKGNTPDKFLELLDKEIEEFISTKDEIMIGREQYALVTVAQDVSNTAFCKGIPIKNEAEALLVEYRKKTRNDNVHILGVTTTDLQTALIDFVGALLCTYGTWDEGKGIVTLTMSGNDVLKNAGMPATDENRNAVFCFLRDVASPIRLMLAHDNGFLDAQPFMIKRSVTQDGQRRTQTDEWTFTASDDVYHLRFSNKNSAEKDNYIKFYAQALQNVFKELSLKSLAIGDGKQDEQNTGKKPSKKLNPNYGGVFNTIHNIQADIARNGNIDKPLSYYGYNEAEDTNCKRQHPKLRAIEKALKGLPENNLEIYRKPKEKDPNKTLYIRGGMDFVRNELREKSKKSNAAKKTGAKTQKHKQTQ